MRLHYIEDPSCTSESQVICVCVCIYIYIFLSKTPQKTRLLWQRGTMAFVTHRKTQTLLTGL
jgi:hypothetical protein